MADFAPLTYGRLLSAIDLTPVMAALPPVSARSLALPSVRTTASTPPFASAIRQIIGMSLLALAFTLSSGRANMTKFRFSSSIAWMTKKLPVGIPTTFLRTKANQKLKAVDKVTAGVRRRGYR